MRRASSLAAILLLACSPCAAQALDTDADGLSDEFEQQMLERFRPLFLVDVAECDGLPAEFRAGVAEPQAGEKNGTIYGQVFRVKGAGPEALIEIHYFHLWAVDCGRKGHPLDVEHVAVLASADRADVPAAAWKARYWYAAAHEDTICDARHGAKAEWLNAVESGPAVWISRGKHASYLAKEICRKGCGGDQCGSMRQMPPGPLVNLGEVGKPMNGTVWAESKAWSLMPKFETAFTADVLKQIDSAKPGQVVGLNPSKATLHGAFRAGSRTADGVETAHRETGEALDTAERHTDRALTVGEKKVDGSIRKAAGAVKRFLGLGKDKKK